MYAPNPQMMPTQEWLAPFEPTDKITGTRNLLVVVGSATEVAAVRDIRNEYPELPIVLWAHLLPEAHALNAEEEYPVVYGQVIPEVVFDAYERGGGRQPRTTTLASAEAIFGLGDVA